MVLVTSEHYPIKPEYTELQSLQITATRSLISRWPDCDVSIMLCRPIYAWMRVRDLGKCARLNTTISGNIHYTRTDTLCCTPKPHKSHLCPAGCQQNIHTIANWLITSSVLTVRPCTSRDLHCNRSHRTGPIVGRGRSLRSFLVGNCAAVVPGMLGAWSRVTTERDCVCALSAVRRVSMALHCWVHTLSMANGCWSTVKSMPARHRR